MTLQVYGFHNSYISYFCLMAKSAPIKEYEGSKNKTSLYLKPLSHQKTKFISLKTGESPNALFEQAIDEFIERWEKKNGEISI